MFGISDLVAGLLIAKKAEEQAAPEPTPEPEKAGLSFDTYAAIARRREEVAYRIGLEETRRRMIAPQPPTLFKLATSCPHCHSNDYLTHNRRVQCAYCRIPAAQQPQHAPRPDNAYHKHMAASMRAARNVYNNRPY